MIKRIVKMSFDPGKLDQFYALFKSSKSTILDFDGIHQVNLYRDNKEKNVLFTISEWDNENSLNNYRNSDFFDKTWQKTKALFIDKPQAWSISEFNDAQ